MAAQAPTVGHLSRRFQALCNTAPRAGAHPNPVAEIWHPNVKVTLLLADAAEAVNGKLYILGGGWSVMGPDPAPMAIAIKIEVPWDQGNDIHKLQLRLVDADGQPVLAESEDSDEVPIVLDADFETGRPAGMKPGTPLDLTMAVTLGPLPLEPGSRFEWRLTIDGKEDDEWRVAFSTRPANFAG